MHILILNWRDPKNPLSGGAEIVTMAHAKAWVKAGHSVTWFTSSFPGAKDKEDIRGVTIIRRGSQYTVHVLAFMYYLFSGGHFDIVIDEIHGLPFFTPLYVRKPKIAFIHEVAGEIWDYMSVFPFNKIGKIIENLYFFLYRRVPFWTDAPSTVDELEAHGIDRQHCTAILCPPINKPLEKLPKKELTLTLLFVSRLVKMKGVEDVIAAFRLMRQRAQLWIVGDGDPSYIRYVHSICPKNVRFFGKVSEAKKLELMRRAHILLHASVKEGWGLVVVEAASQGTPSIVYNVSGLRDSVKNDQTGILLDENTPEEMKKEIVSLIADKNRYAMYQKNCLAWAKSLSWRKMSSQSLKFILKVAKQ